MAADFAAELKKNREEKLNANKKKEKKEKKKGNVWLLELRSLTWRLYLMCAISLIPHSQEEKEERI